MNIRNRVKEMRLVKPDEVSPNPRNWRSHPQAQRDALRGILADVGIAGAVLAYESKRHGGLTLIDGHERMTVGVAFPALILDVSDEEADKLLATFDPISAMAETNATALDSLLRDVSTDNAALAQMLDDLATEAGLYVEPQRDLVEDEVPEPPVNPITKPGDLWLLGDHRLLCGDSTKSEDVERLMDGAKAECVITDPPYAFSLASTSGTKGKSNQWHDALNMSSWFRDLYQQLSVLCPDGAIWVFTNWRTLPMLLKASMDSQVFIDSMLVWHKDWIGPGGSKGLRPSYELCALSVTGDFAIPNRGIPDLITVPWSSHKPNGHQAEKPTDLIIKLIDWSNAQSVIDFFLGSGTTLIAAEQLGRNCYGMEISPAYCDVIVKRWETLTGNKAIRQTIGEL